MTRQAILDGLRSHPQVQVLIVGGGVNGIGLFRELALQGVEVLLVERGDFCSGASAASSHMAHGGIRYLENGEFRLVREALTERNLLLQNAPHAVKPLPTTIPIFSRWSGLFNAPLKFLGLSERPSQRGWVVIKIGLLLYDWFARQYRSMPRHSSSGRDDALRLRPSLNANVIATATYYDAWMPYPERLCLEMVLDAEAASPQAHALNYVSLQGAQGDTVTLHDEVSGDRLTVQPQIVVNAAGPWIDFTNQAMQRDTAFIGGTKGSHIVVDHPQLHEACAGHEVFFENKDGRICLLLPFMGRVMIGTTDIRIDDPDTARCTDEEIDYMLELVRVVFPEIEVNRSHIVFRFSGMRPLPRSESGLTGRISRDHSVKTVEVGDGQAFPVLSLVGGKWTTFRAFAEQTADRVLDRVGQTRQVSTDNMPIGGGRDYPESDTGREGWLEDLQTATNLPHERLETLFERYGTRAREMATYITNGTDEALRHQPDASRREIAFLAINEKVEHLDDVLLRRSSLAMLGYVTPELLDEIAVVVGEVLGWTDKQTRQEIERTRAILMDKHGVRLGEVSKISADSAKKP